MKCESHYWRYARSMDVRWRTCLGLLQGTRADTFIDSSHQSPKESKEASQRQRMAQDAITVALAAMAHCTHDERLRWNCGSPTSR